MIKTHKTFSIKKKRFRMSMFVVVFALFCAILDLSELSRGHVIASKYSEAKSWSQKI